MKILMSLITLSLCLNAMGEVRTFTGKSGRTVTGEIIKYTPQSQKVTIKLENGQKTVLSAQNFSQSDQEYILQWIKKKEVSAKPKQERLLISGFEVSFADGCRITLSVDGHIKNVTMPSGDIKQDSKQNIKSVGSAEVKRDNTGKLKRVGRITISRDTYDRITSVGGLIIKRDSADRIKSIGGAEIKRNSSGEIKSVYSNGAPVKAVLSIITE